jgi:hypothetical protein
MTPDAQQPKQQRGCTKEREYIITEYQLVRTESKEIRDAVRSRPHTSAPLIDTNYNCRFCSGRSSCESFGHVKHCNDFELDVAKLNRVQKDHDAAIARTATLAIIAAIRKFYSDLPEHDASCPFDKMNSDECRGYECDCGTCILEHALESLRQHQGGEQR